MTPSPLSMNKTRWGEVRQRIGSVSVMATTSFGLSLLNFLLLCLPPTVDESALS